MISAHIVSRRRRNRNRNRSRSPVTIDLELQTVNEILDSSLSSCIDLTCDDDDIVTVDLTSVNDSSVVYLDSHSTRRRRYNRRNRINTFYPPISVVESESEIVSEDELQELPLPSIVNSHTAIQKNEPVNSSAKTIACPICLDEDKRLQETDRHLMSTICGHVFCNDCLSTAVQAQHKCPTCRRRLTIRQIHPLFI